jgi:mono/diheme cytochrome c family protein
MMSMTGKTLGALAGGIFMLVAVPAGAQQPSAQSKGAELVGAKCAQCHSSSMWQDQRQDARAWEANLYRMIGRGALWTGEEVKLMAEYLGTDFGPNVPAAKPAEPPR